MAIAASFPLALGQGDKITEILTWLGSFPNFFLNSRTTGRTQVVTSPGPLERINMSTFSIIFRF